jgi:segregation and condensation protein A
MDIFEEELKKGETDDSDFDKGKKVVIIDKIGQNQFYDIITSRKPDWQAIIYDLIHTEQLDPWDIDIIKLTDKYFERIKELDALINSDTAEEIDFYDSSKVLFAAALLLRIKSEFLLNKHMRSIDEILFGRKDEDKKIFTRIEVNEDELPLLVPRTPLPRARRVTLSELMAALSNAINTESRRIKREVAVKRAQKLSEVDFPQFRRIDIKDRIKHFYAKVLTSVRKKAVRPEHELNKVGFSELIGREREEKLACFLPLLHLSNSKKLWLEQERHLDEIWIFLHEYFIKNRDKFIEELEEDIESMKEEFEKGENLDEEQMIIEKSDKSSKEMIDAINEEIDNISKEEKIEGITGFEEEVE